MKAKYDDIRDRIAGEPVWYDSNGTPRYNEFSPGDCPNVYADTVVLLRIECQGCSKSFDVSMNGNILCPINRPRELHYGDPPAHGCVGDSMNCNDKEILQMWHRKDWKWIRYPQIEGEMG